MWELVLKYLNPNANINVSILFIFVLSYFLEHKTPLRKNLNKKDFNIIEEDVHQVVMENFEKNRKSVFSKNSSILFIGGVPKSGTTLMRILLDIHSGIRWDEDRNSHYYTNHVSVAGQRPMLSSTCWSWDTSGQTSNTSERGMRPPGSTRRSLTRYN